MDLRSRGLILPAHPAGTRHRRVDRLRQTQKQTCRDTLGVVIHAAYFVLIFIWITSLIGP
jgi:hypothetical protein